MKIVRPVQVKVILTEGSKNELEIEYKDRLAQLKIEMEQLRFQGKKILHEAGKKGTDQIRILQEKIRNEEKKKHDQIEQNEFQIEQLELLPIGTEILHSTIESEVTIQIGDAWDDLMKKAEIIIKDGIIHEIREGREEDE